MKITITEANGWSKTISVEKNIAYIGCAPENDIQLSSPDVAPVHLQILSSPLLPSSARVVNLDGEVEIFSRGAEDCLQPYHTSDLYDGDELQVGTFRLSFSLPLAAGVVRSSGSIEAKLWFPSAVLHPDQPLEGRLTIRNIGNQNNCQVRLAITGFPASCYQVDPIPLIYSSAQEEVRLLLLHRQTAPAAGLQNLIVTVSAPESYPGEAFVIRQGIFVMPVFQQAIKLVDDLAANRVLQTSDEPQIVVTMPEPNSGGLALAPAGGYLPVEPPVPQAAPEQPFLGRPDSELPAPEPDLLELFPGLEPPPANQPTPPAAVAVEQSEAQGQPQPTGQAPPAAAVEPAARSEPPPAGRPRKTPVQDRSKLKVVRDQAEDFWEGK